MRRYIALSLLALLVLTIALLGTAWYLSGNEAFLKSQLSRIVLEQTGRELRIEGPLELAIGRETRVEAGGIHYQNAAWADAPDMLSIGRLEAVIDIPSLWSGKPVIKLVALEDCSISLLENEAGEANWDVLPEAEAEPDAPDEPGGLPVSIRDLQVYRCQARIDGPGRDSPTTLVTEEFVLHMGEDMRVQGQGRGRVDEQDLQLDGWVEPIDAFIAGGPLEHDLSLQLGEITLRSSGSLADAATLSGANITARLRGPEIARVLEKLTAPPVSDGDFDFQVRLATAPGKMTQIAVSGDLGSVQADASGELDRLSRPTQGELTARIDGPNLQPLGEALGIGGLVAEPYRLTASADFEDGAVSISDAVLDIAGDRLAIQGGLGKLPLAADSVLDVELSSMEIGKWAQTLGQAPMEIGALAVKGRLSSDEEGLFSVDAELVHGETRLALKGTIGPLAGPYEPALEIDLNSRDPRPLAALLGQPDFPDLPVTATGLLSMMGQQVRLQGLRLALAEHRAFAEGTVNLADPYSGTDIEFELDVKNLAELSWVIGRQDLPEQPVTVSGSVSTQDRKMQLRGLQLALAEHRATVDGVINLADRYSGSELEIELDVKNLAQLGRIFGQQGLPEQPARLTSTLKPDGKGLSFQVMDGNLGEMKMEVEGRIADLDQPLGVDAKMDIRLPSLQLLAPLAPQAELPDLPLVLRGSLQNEQSRTRLESVRIEVGRTEASIDGEIHLDQSFDLQIKVKGPDVSRFNALLGQELLPDPFAVSAGLEGNPQSVVVSGLDARLGKSLLRGDLTIDLGELTRIRGRLDSPYLDLSQWNTGEEEESQVAAEQPPSEWVFDNRPPMQIDDIGADIVVDLSLDKVDLGNTLIEEVDLGIQLLPQFLRLDPLSLRGTTGGKISGTAVLDGRGEASRFDFDLNAREMRLGLMAVEGQEAATIPPTTIDLELHAVGKTRREMASGLDGKIRVSVGSGQVAASGIDFLLSDFVTELFTLLNPFAETSEYTVLECAVYAADIESGQVAVFPVIFHTEQLTILSEGTVDLDTEHVDLSFNTKVRKGLGLSAGMIINPLIKVGGRLNSPAIELDPKGTVITGGLAVATAGISLLAKSMNDRFLSSEDPCGDALKEIEKRETSAR
jgi:uncharacterized protein involved in outer membrane biogenesis